MNDQTGPSVTSGPFTVRPITAKEAQETVLAVGGSFLQTPQWSRTKPDWGHRHLGWFDAEGRRVGAALVLSRNIPRTHRSFAYLPEGPALPWEAVASDPAAWLDPLVAWARSTRAFALRLGFAVPSRTWAPEPVKKQVAAGGLLSFTSLPATVDNPVARTLDAWLSAGGWRPIGAGSGAAVGQPRFVCVLDLAGRDAPTVLRAMNQQWRRNIKKAQKAGVQVRALGAEGVETFHALYCESAQRDGFHPRPRAYFDTIIAAFAGPEGHADGRGSSGGTEDPLGDDRISGHVYEAHLDGDVLASAIMLRVGDTFSYLYGGSTERNRDARASNALQWQAIQDAIAAGCTAYDFRGFNTSLGATSPLTGLLLFKLGAGADVVELVGEREVVLGRFWHTVFERAMALRVAVNKRRLHTSPGADAGG